MCAGRPARPPYAGRSTPTRIMTFIEEFKVSIPSDTAEGQAVQERIVALLEKLGYPSRDVFGVRLALEEALVNAIKHGNKLDPNKKVRVEAKVTPQRVEIEVEDQGPGFDRACVPDPTAEENLCKCSGRGILLIEAYMNSVEWSRGGRRVRMIRYNDPHELPERS